MYKKNHLTYNQTAAGDSLKTNLIGEFTDFYSCETTSYIIYIHFYMTAKYFVFV